MSDRRPSKLISGHHLRMSWMEDGEWVSRPATVADIRRGVESGTIKGEVVTGELGENSLEFYQSDSGYGHTYIVIPVSDGGSET